jgi:hypothetical protein
MTTSDSEEEGEEVTGDKPVLDYARPKKRKPLTPVVVDWTLRIVVWVTGCVATILGVLLLMAWAIRLFHALS